MKKLLYLFISVTLLGGLAYANFGQSIVGDSTYVTLTHYAECDSGRVYFGYPVANLYKSVKLLPLSADSMLLRGRIALDSIGNHDVEITYYLQGSGTPHYYLGIWMNEDARWDSLDAKTSSRSIAGDAMTLTPAERQAVADTDEARLDLSSKTVGTTTTLTTWDKTGYSLTTADKQSIASITADSMHRDSLFGWLIDLNDDSGTGGTGGASIDEIREALGDSISVYGWTSAQKDTVLAMVDSFYNVVFAGEGVDIGAITDSLIKYLPAYACTIVVAYEDTIFPFNPGVPDSPNKCRLYGCIGDANEWLAGGIVLVKPNADYMRDTAQTFNEPVYERSAYSDEDGFFWIDVHRSTVMEGFDGKEWQDSLTYHITILAPDMQTVAYQIDSLFVPDSLQMNVVKQ